MHRFLQYADIENARIALRSDASIWIIAKDGRPLSVHRGSGWQRANRIRLCAGDRVRVGESEAAVSDLCGRLGVKLDQACSGVSPENTDPGSTSVVPLSVPASVIDHARRNPGTGQIESSPRE